MKKILLLLGMILLMTSQTYALTIREINTSPESVGIESEFTIFVQLEGNSCNSEVNFYLDGKLESTKELSCDSLLAESRVLDAGEEDLGCGKHEIRVELFSQGAGVMNLSKDLWVGSQPNVSVDYGSPSKEIRMNFSDAKTGDPIYNLHLSIYNVKKGPSTSESLSTDYMGMITFIPNEYGEYHYHIDDSDYCGNDSVYYKKIINVDGPYPIKPMVGELITLAVPMGVGIKVLDSNGDLYTTGIVTNFGGGVNLTINDPGNYILSLGDINSYYWSKNISITVLGKENTTIKVTPEAVLRGGEVTIEIWSAGTKLGNAKLTIEDSAKQSSVHSTNENGTLVFKPESSGKYTVRFEDDKHVSSQAAFEARNNFRLDYSPEKPRTDGDITLFARDQLNNLVSGATISVEGTTYGLTGLDGKYSFKVNAPGTHKITATKEGFWDASIGIYVISPVYIQLKSDEVEYGAQINPRVFDTGNNEVLANIKVVKPSGAVVYINGSFVPDEVGEYELYAGADNYIGASKNFTVKPIPLELSLVLSKDRLYINTTSREVPIAGITLTIEKADGSREKLVTDERGSAVLYIKEGGRIKITANEGRLNPRYESITVVRNLIKQYDYTTLLIALSIIGFVALIGVALVYLTPKKEEPRKVIKPYYNKDWSGKIRKSRL